MQDKETEPSSGRRIDPAPQRLLRTLRALRDMRRYTPVVIQNAGQVNVAAQGGQQVKVALDNHLAS